MQTPKRHHEPDVIQRLLDEPYRFQFAQLLNILVQVLRRQGLSYDKAFGQVLRFRNSLSLAFPPSEIERLQVEHTGDSNDKEALLALQHSERLRIHITPAFIGLLGASGALPLHDTERTAAARSKQADEGWHAFVDLFSNRVVGMFYEAWGKYRVEQSFNTHAHDELLPMLMALAGVSPTRSLQPASNEAAPVAEEAAGYYAALLRTRPISAATVTRVLTEYFGMPIQIEEFVGCWDPIPQNRRSTLGVTAPTLGYGAVLGTRLWRSDLRARLNIGPLNEKQAQAFLPNGDALRALQGMTRLFSVPSVRYEIRLLLAAPCIKPLTLATRGPDTRQLGWNTFLRRDPGEASRPDVRSMLHVPMPTKGSGERTQQKHKHH